MKPILIPVSVGELIDKITILEIKSQLIKDTNKLVNIRFELDKLLFILIDLKLGEIVKELQFDLFQVNRKLWDIENFKRSCEANQNFGSEFVEAARQVYKLNDQRAALKKQINELTGSVIKEEKLHTINEN